MTGTLDKQDGTEMKWTEQIEPSKASTSVLSQRITFAFDQR